MICLSVIIEAKADVPVDLAQWNYNKKMYRSVVMMSDIKNTTKWDAEKETLPLSRKQAIAIGIQGLETHTAPFVLHKNNEQSWVAGNVSLKNLAGTNLWFYRLEFFPALPGSNMTAPVVVFVDFSGKFIPLRVIEDTPR